MSHPASVPEIAAHLAWLAIQEWLGRREPERAEAIEALAHTPRLHRYEPRLAVLAARTIVGHARPDPAERLLAGFAVRPSTNLAWAGTVAALTHLRADVAVARRRRLAKPKDPKRDAPRGTWRPAERVRPGPFRARVAWRRPFSPVSWSGRAAASGTRQR